MHGFLNFVVIFIGMGLIIVFGVMGSIALGGAFSDRFYSRYYLDRLPTISQSSLIWLGITFWIITFFVAFAMKITVKGI
jgi:hypothetical protein